MPLIIVSKEGSPGLAAGLYPFKENVQVQIAQASIFMPGAQQA